MGPQEEAERTILNGIPMKSSKADRQEGAKKKALEGIGKTFVEAVEDSLNGEKGALLHPLYGEVKGLKEHRGERVAKSNAMRVKALDELIAEGRLVRHLLDHLGTEDRKAMGLPTKGPAPALLLMPGRTAEAYVARKLGQEVDPLDEDVDS